MNNLKATILIPTYKDNTALKLILDALQLQTYKNFDIVIAEDNNSSETKAFLDNYDSIFNIRHFTHEDKGNRKAVILNKALASIDSDYLIFIDGDVIPYSTFIESHMKLSEEKKVLCGRRVNLGDKVSSDLRKGKVIAYDLERDFFKRYKYLSDDNIRHYEQGIYFKPQSYIYQLLHKFDKNAHILGSNFSCFRKDMEAINGFDEDIIGGSKDDVDLEWRFLKLGCEMKSCKFSANLFHLNHPRDSRIEDIEIAKKQMKENRLKNKFRCTNGIKKI